MAVGLIIDCFNYGNWNHLDINKFLNPWNIIRLIFILVDVIAYYGDLWGQLVKNLFEPIFTTTENTFVL